MLHSRVINWVVGLTISLRLSQRKTLAELVHGAMRCRRVSLADIGRALETKTTVKHNIRRIWRFLKNDRVEVHEGVKGLIRLAVKAARGRLFVAVDWVDIGQYKVLRAAVPLRGRSVPILFAAYHKWALFRSQNNFEEGFLRLLKSLLPEKTEVVIIADRGFGRAELAQTLQEIGLNYVIRVCEVVWFSSDRHSGQLDRVRLKPGSRRDLGFGLYRKTKPVRQRILVYWEKHKKEPWFLETDMDWGWKYLVVAYKQRMMIEELFRDEKNIRYGWGLRQLKVSGPERLERMFLVLAYAYLLLLLFGLLCRREMSQAHWSSTTSKKKPTSAFVIGRQMIEKVRFRLHILLRLFETLMAEDLKGNWR